MPLRLDSLRISWKVVDEYKSRILVRSLMGLRTFFSVPYAPVSYFFRHDTKTVFIRMLSDCFTTFLWVFYDIFADYMQRKYVKNTVKIRTLSVAVMMMARMKLLDELFAFFV